MTIICRVCREALGGMWDPDRTARVSTWESLDKDLRSKLDPRNGRRPHTEWKLPEFLYGLNRDREPILDWLCCEMCDLKPLTRKRSGFGQSAVDFGYDAVFFVAWFLERDQWTPMITCLDASLTSIQRLFLVPMKDHKNVNFWGMGSSTNDWAAWQLMDKWLETCISAHAPCNKESQVATEYSPTRLLKLGPQNTWHIEERKARPATSVKYAALSYCWGIKPPESLLRLLQSNQTEVYRKHSQFLDELPKTFKDAAKVAQHFGLEYLWIDRLCICQDSSKDWEHEAGHMRDVYHNAHLHIAALGANDSDDGLFFDRNAAKILPSVIDLRLAEGSEETSYIANPRGPHRNEPYRSAYLKPFFRGPILDRSWVVQERLLARRSLYFGQHQLYWECRERHCCEIVPEGIAADDYGFEHPHKVHSTGKDDRQTSSTEAGLLPRNVLQWKHLIDGYGWGLQLSQNPLERLFAGWGEILRNYTNKNITYSRDKIVALSGIAREMESSLHAIHPTKEYRYLAGLWEDDLMMSLPWTAKAGGRRSETYRAPTWSWAAFDMKLSNVRLKTGAYICAKLVDAKIVPKNKDIMGEIKSASLTLRGPCGMIRFEANGSINGKVTALKDYKGGNIAGEFSPGRVYLDIDMEQGRTTGFIWIAIDCYGSKWRGHGLILQEVEQGRAERLGVVNYDFLSKDEALEFISKFSSIQLTII